MNLKLVGIVTVILFFVTASNLINYVFAQSDLGSQMDTAKKAALAGMKHVKSAMKSGGLKSGVEAAKGTMKSSMTSSLGAVTNKTNSELVKTTKKNLGSDMKTAKNVAETGMDQVKSAMKQKTNGSSASMDDKKMNHFNQIRDKLMQSKFKPNPLAASR